MNTNQIEQDIINAYETDSNNLEYKHLTVTLLSYGVSLSRQKKEDEVIIFKDLFDRCPLFFVHQILGLLDQTEVIPEIETEVKEVSKEEFDQFCNTYHFNKGTNSKLRYGLFYNNTLLLVAGFSKPKKSYENHQKIFKADLYRLVENHSPIAENGTKKIIDFFIKEHDISELSTQVNNEFEKVNEYLNVGFEVKEEYSENVFWLFSETNERFSTGQLLKKGLIRKENLNHMVHPPKGYLPIKDMGGKLLVLKI